MASFEICGNFKHDKVQMDCDQQLKKNMQKPLSSIRSGSFIVIAGSAGSGKTNMLCNMFNCKKCPTSGKKRDLMKCFHNIMIVSPSLKSFVKGNELSMLPDSHKFEDLNTFLDDYDELIEDSEDQNCVIFDDIGNSIRTQKNLTKFKAFVDNRRHEHMTIILLLQSLVQIPPPIRASVNLITSFLPKTLNEKELLFEYTGLHKRNMHKFYKEIFTDKYDSVTIDLTLTDSPNFLFYKNMFNPILIKN